MNRWISALGVLGLVVSGGWALGAQDMKTVWDGVYTEQQATRGALLYDEKCAGCHGPAGAGGGMAGALTGPAFAANYDGQTVFDLYERNRTTMPPEEEGQLTAAQYTDITAYMLQCNKFPAGTEELPSQPMRLRQIQYLMYEP